MKRVICLMFVAILAALLPAPASADVKSWLKSRVPGVEINIPNPMSRTGKPAIRAKADGNGVRRIGGGTGNVIVAGGPSSGTTSSGPVSSLGSEQQSRAGSGDGVVIVPPSSGATAKIPSFAGTVVAVRSQRFQPLRLVDLESAIQREFMKRGASVVRAPTGYAGNPCDIGQPVICVVVQDPVEGYLEGRGGYDSYSSSRQNSSWNSSGYSSGQFKNYHVAVLVELWAGDGSAPQLLGGAAKNFEVTLNAYSNSYYSSSRSSRDRSSSSSGSAYSSQEGDDFMGEAARAARKAVDHLLKKEKAWFPGAAQLVRETFHQ